MKRLAFLILFIACYATGQSYADEREVIQSPGLNSENAQLSFANQQTGQLTPNSQLITIPQNIVFIDQVGTGNTAQAVAISDDSQILISQNGINNNAQLLLNSQRIRANVNQIGISNRLFDYSLGNAQLHELNVTQNGNYNTTISVGTNSNAERLRVNQVGVGSTVHVIHF